LTQKYQIYVVYIQNTLCYNLINTKENVF